MRAGKVSPATEAELHAYLDGELDPARIEVVEAHFLRDDPDAMRFGTYRRHSDLMRRVYGKLDVQPLSDAMLPQAPVATPAEVRRSGRGGWLLALLMALALGIAAGWFGQLEYAQRFETEVPTALEEALAAYRIAQSDRPAGVEVMGGAARTTLEWLNREFGFAAKSPSLPEEGFEVISGQLVPSPAGVAAHLLLREGSGERLSLYVRPGGAQELTPFETGFAAPMPMVMWDSGGASLVLVGEQPEERLLEVAEAIQTSLVAPAPRPEETS